MHTKEGGSFHLSLAFSSCILLTYALRNTGLKLENVQIIIVNLQHVLRGPKKRFFTIQGNSWHFSHVPKVDAKLAIPLSYFI